MLCARRRATQKHHLRPKAYRGSSKTIPICSYCHRAIHITFTNKQLKEEYYSVERLIKYRETLGFKRPEDSKYWRDGKWRNILKDSHYQIKSAMRGRE